jgi:hypothetical protein
VNVDLKDEMPLRQNWYIKSAPFADNHLVALRAKTAMYERLARQNAQGQDSPRAEHVQSNSFHALTPALVRPNVVDNIADDIVRAKNTAKRIVDIEQD